METTLTHLQVNVRPENLGFYRDLTAFLGWHAIVDTNEMLGTGASNGASVWFLAATKDVPNDYDGVGVNHLGVGAASQADVDATVAYLREHGVTPLFDTPRHRPEFTGSEEQTYYQVMFESPDRILFEVVYTGPKS